jgi:hypothetical protein
MTTPSAGPVPAGSPRSRSRGTGPTSSEGAQHDRQLREPARRPCLSRPDPRQSARKPLRVYLLDGVNDNRGPAPGSAGQRTIPRDWHLQNLRMLAALTEKGYDVNFSWGIGSHNAEARRGALPEMLRWLWRDYPRTDDPHRRGQPDAVSGQRPPRRPRGRRLPRVTGAARPQKGATPPTHRRVGALRRRIYNSARRAAQPFQERLRPDRRAAEAPV